MDSTPEDDVLAISRFLTRLQMSLGDGLELTRGIETQMKQLASKSNLDYDSFNPDQQQEILHNVQELDLDLPADVLEESRLQRENLELLLAIQRQDYMSSNYEKLISEHQDLMESIKNSVSNRKEFLNVKGMSDSLVFDDKRENLNRQISKLQQENKSYNEIFQSKISKISTELESIGEIQGEGLDQVRTKLQELASFIRDFQSK